jgi:hypothetical protein
MRHDEFVGICNSVSSGEEKRLKHIVTHQVGKIVSVNREDEFFEVDVDGRRKTWSKDNVKVLQ